MAGPGVLYQTGIHASRPANGAGCVLYACTTHGLIYLDDGSSWTTFADLPSLAGSPAAEDVGFTPAGTIAATDVQAAIEEVAAEAGGGVNTGTPFEVDYVAFTSAVNITATSEATADTVVTAGAESFDGSTLAIIEFFAPMARPAASANATIDYVLYDGASSIGLIGRQHAAAASSANFALYLVHRLTPSNASHTYSIRAFVSTGTGVVTGGAGGSGNRLPGFIRISKLTA